MDTRYLTPNQVAHLLRVKPITVRRWIQQGILTAEEVREGKRHRYLIAQQAVDTLRGKLP
jgi:excisionase family DNA binding protein